MRKVGGSKSLPVLGRADGPWSEATAARAGAAGAGRWMARALLGVPLYYKILLANGVLVVAGIAAGSLFTAEYLRADPGRSVAELLWLLVLAGVVVSMIMNGVILRLALHPLALLERTAARIQGGDLEARVPDTPVADRDLERVAHTFNSMLESLSTYRRRLREIAVRALDAAEEERKRVSRELHDGTAQTLAALMVRLKVARSTDDPARRDELLNDVRQEIEEALEGVRRFARGLRPPALDELGLETAICSHARSVESTTGKPIEVEVDGVDGALAPEAELALYRIVQEALANVARHAAAPRVSVRVRREAGRVVAEVEDDGRGFAVDAVLATDEGGLGLFGMQERATYVGGRVTIRSRIGRGTQVRAEIPTAPLATAPRTREGGG